MRTIALPIALLLALGAMAAKDTKERPVSKVINMLNDMSAQLEAEAKADEEAYEKMGCYCDTNEKQKTKAIADAEQRILDLTHTIEAMTGKSTTLTSEIEQLNKNIADNDAGLAKSTDIRTKERADFVADEKNMLVSVTGLKSAVTVLGKHNEGLTQESLISLATTLKHKVSPKDLNNMLQRRHKKAFMSFLQQPAGYQSYAPQSGEIFGVLKQMKESFEKNLADSTKEEQTAETEFANMKAAKTEEMDAAAKAVQNKETERANAGETKATAEEDLQTTQEQLAADTEFLATLKTQCTTFDAEYEERTKTRTEEILAVSETIGILTDDDAHDQFSATLGFIQLSMKTRRASMKELASQRLLAAAKKANDPRLSALAVSMQLNAFAFVKEKVEAMIVDLEAEKDEEIKKRDTCNADLHSNEQDQKMKYDDKADLENTIATLENDIAGVNDELKVMNDDIEATRVEMKRASEDREIENKDFQETVADQRACQGILTKALDRLKQFYDKKALLQLKAKQESGSFTTYKKSEKSGGVIAMIQGIIDESVGLEREALQAEQDSQAAYEQFIQESNKSITTRQDGIADKKQSRGEKDAELTTAKGDLKATMDDLHDLDTISKNLHNSCDFLLGNFATRVEARDMEVEALRASVAMLSGAH